MPKHENLQSAGKHSTRTASTKAVRPTTHTYQVSIHALGHFSEFYKNGIYITKLFRASSKQEAVGKACEYVKITFPRHAILAETIKCAIVNPDTL